MSYTEFTHCSHNFQVFMVKVALFNAFCIWKHLKLKAKMLHVKAVYLLNSLKSMPSLKSCEKIPKYKLFLGSSSYFTKKKPEKITNPSILFNLVLEY